MNLKKEIPLSRAILCVVLCVVFAVLTTYQFCFYTLFYRYRTELAAITREIGVRDAKNAELTERVEALSASLDTLTDRLCTLTGSVDGTAEDCLRLLLRQALIQGGADGNFTPAAHIEAEVDAYLATYAADYVDVAERLLFIDYLYRENYYTEGPSGTALKEAITEGYIRAAGDVYGQYYTPEEYRAFRDKLNATSCGIGAVMTYVEEKNAFLVLHVHSGSPAKQAGLAKLDLIVAVDGRPFTDQESAVAAMTGEAGTTLTVTVVHENEEQEDLSLTRAVVEGDTVITRVHEEAGRTVGYLRITTFSAKTADQLAAALTALEDAEVEALVFDMRDNSGGLLTSIIDVLNLLLPEGLPLISFQYRNELIQKDTVSSKDDDKQLSLPVTVLQNRETSSAAEIFCAAMKAHAGATLVGEQTYGKGVMQTGYLLEDDDYISVSVATFAAADGRSHNGEGIDADEEIAVADGYEHTSIYVLPEEADLPLARALALAAAACTE